MIKINGNEAIISKMDLNVLIGAAAGYFLLEHDASYSMSDFCMRIAAVIHRTMEGHIWGTEKIPEPYYEMERSMIRVDADPDASQDPAPAGEDKQAICRLLLAALQKTRAYHDLTDLMYDPHSGKVLAKYAGRSALLINTECDSGIAMVNDILAHI